MKHKAFRWIPAVLLAALLAALTALGIGTAAAEGVKIDGSIKAGETKTILAPYSGVIGDYTAQVGDEAPSQIANVLSENVISVFTQIASDTPKPTTTPITPPSSERIIASIRNCT